jgi:hypothetical protein
VHKVNTCFISKHTTGISIKICYRGGYLKLLANIIWFILAQYNSSFTLITQKLEKKWHKIDLITISDFYYKQFSIRQIFRPNTIQDVPFETQPQLLHMDPLRHETTELLAILKSCIRSSIPLQHPRYHYVGCIKYITYSTSHLHDFCYVKIFLLPFCFERLEIHVLSSEYGCIDLGQLSKSQTAGWSTEVQSQHFFLRHHAQTGSGVHPASCPMGIGGSFTGDYAVGS